MTIPAMMSPGEPAAIMQVALAEFAALRSEIQNRSSAAWTLVNLNITVTGTILGFVLAKKADLRLLLALPLLVPSLGMLFIDHAYNINNLGSYIKTRLCPLVRQLSGRVDLLGYEEAIDAYEKNKLLRFLPFGAPLTILFSGVPAAALVFVWPRLNEPWAWAVWALGFALVLAHMILWGIFVIDPQRLDPLRGADRAQSR